MRLDQAAVFVAELGHGVAQAAGLCIVAVVVAVNLLGERLAERDEERR